MYRNTPERTNAIKVNFNSKRTTIAANSYQTIPLVSIMIINYMGNPLLFLLMVLIYPICIASWALCYHAKLHFQNAMDYLEDIFSGVFIGEFLTFEVAKPAHTYHHKNSERAERYSECIKERFKDDPQEIQKHTKFECYLLDADFYFVDATNEINRFFRCFIVDLWYQRWYMKDGKWTNLDRLFSKLALMLTPFIISYLNPSILPVWQYLAHILICRSFVAITFMVFTTYVHTEGKLDPIFNSIDRYINTDLVLELLFTHFVHHIRYHNDHHKYPRRDMSVLAKIVSDQSQKWNNILDSIQQHFNTFNN